VPKPGKALMNTAKGPGYIFKDKDLDRSFPVEGARNIGSLVC
jgi:hypothetical protein